MNDIISEFSAYLVNHKNYSKTSIYACECDLTIFFRFLRFHFEDGHKRESINSLSTENVDIEMLRQVNLDILHAFFYYLKHDRKNGRLACGRKHSVLKEFFHYLTHSTYLLDVNPMITFYSPKRDSVKPLDTLSVSEAKHLLKCVSGSHEERNRAILTIFLTCGLRRSELCGLLRINDLGDFLLVNGPNSRTLPINALCREALDAYLPIRDEHMNFKKTGYLFITDQKKGIKPRSITDVVYKHLKDATLDPARYSAESLRQTCIKLLVDQGENLEVLKDFFGFASTNPLERYLENNKSQKLTKHPLDLDE